MREGANHDHVDIARENARRVAKRLTSTDLDVAGRQEERVPTQLIRTDLKRHARACRALFENQTYALPREGLLLVHAALHLAREFQNSVQFFTAEVRNSQEMFGHASEWSP